jgi:hypothetical protein
LQGVARVVNPKQFQKEKKNSKKKAPEEQRREHPNATKEREREREIRVLRSFITEVTVFAFSFLPLIYI